jgi:hypothetical protein
MVFAPPKAIGLSASFYLGGIPFPIVKVLMTQLHKYGY